MDKIILIGGGGLCGDVIDTIRLTEQYEIAGVIDLSFNIGKEILGVPVIGEDKDIEKYFKKGIKNCFIAVGSIGKPRLRMKLFDLAKGIGFKFSNIIHPAAIISKFAQLGNGNYIAANVVVSQKAKIGNLCIVNSLTFIGHHCDIGDFVHIAPGVTISGGVVIGEHSHIGTGASVIQYKKVGKNTIIGAGSVVVKDVGDDVVAYGSPCRRRKKNEE